MTINTTSSFNLTAQQIITNALTLLGVYSPNDTLATNDFNTCLAFLNMLAKHWEALGIHIWAEARATIWLQPGQKDYSLGSGTTDAQWANTMVETSTTATAALGASSITVTTVTGMTVADNIGVVLDNSLGIQWLTIGSINTSTKVVGLSGGTLTSSATSGAYVYTFTSRPIKPLQIQSSVRRSNLTTEVSDVIMPGISFYDYQQLTNKNSTGTPLQWRLTPGTGSAILTLWPVPIDSTQRVHIEYLRPLFDFTTTTDNPDLPQEWLLTLVYNLAVLLAPAYGKSQMIQILAPMAGQMLMELDGYDREKTPLFIQPSKYRF